MAAKARRIWKVTSNRSRQIYQDDAWMPVTRFKAIDAGPHVEEIAQTGNQIAATSQLTLHF